MNEVRIKRNQLNKKNQLKKSKKSIELYGLKGYLKLEDGFL